MGFIFYECTITELVNNLEKNDQSEMEKTGNIRKQQTRFYFHQNPIFLNDQNIKKYQHYIDAR